MIKAEDFQKMTQEQCAAADPLEFLATALSLLAVRLDEARAGKDAGLLLQSIAGVCGIADRLEVMGTDMLKKVTEQLLKKIEAGELGEPELPKEAQANKGFDFTLGMTQKPGQA